MNRKDDKSLALELSRGNEKAFETIFNRYYQSLCLFSKQILNDDELAEETVQDLFVKIWEKRFSLSIDTSLRHYLFMAARNLCFNQLQHQKIKKRYAQKILENTETEIKTDEYYLEPGLKQAIEKALGLLPPKRKEIFRLSREEGLKYKEIADRLDISVKTVEAQMGLALKFLRDQLKDFSDIVNFFFFLLKKNS
ncbi:MAG: RNA polymerase sigma-70 factor [Prolixibacteraceae bacterium]|jgi:RNA polymerase sigma-70 factor (ECF subfamily)|nr:RNA polymerase sigma-70 factor [Prolixibacteraceae bacterium]